MSSFDITSKIKFLGNTFFIWSVPLVIVLLNILNQRDIFNYNLLMGVFLGLIINFIWKMIFYFIDLHQIREPKRFYKLI